MYKIVLFLAGTLCFASFVWAVKFHFKSKKKRLGTYMISFLSLFAYIHYAYQLKLSTVSYAVFVIVFVGHTLIFIAFWYSIQTTRNARLPLIYEGLKSSEIITHGPFKVARHPFYSLYVLFWLLCVLATPNWTMITLASLLFLLYVMAAKKEESLLFLHNAKEYQIYSENVGMFFPKRLR